MKNATVGIFNVYNFFIDAYISCVRYANKSELIIYSVVNTILIRTINKNRKFKKRIREDKHVVTFACMKKVNEITSN